MAFLEVKNVKKVYTTRFGTNKVEALKNVNFTAEKGEYLAIMGESGSGKTTLLNVLASIDKASSGKIILNGKEMDTIKDKELAQFRREHLGFVFQDFNLLDSFTLGENICLPLVLAGKKYPQIEPQLLEVARKVNITELLGKYPYEVSGGQKQRLLITRALAKHPQILVLDDSSSALDYATDARLRRAIQENYGDLTSIIVAQRISSIYRADKIIVLEDGEMIGYGTHKNLMESCEVYREISQSQMGGGIDEA